MSARSIRSSSSPRARRRARDEVELAAVDVDVGLEPRDAELGRGVGDRPAEQLQLLEDRLGALRSEQPVDAGELQERDRDGAVLALPGLEREMPAQRLGDERLEVVLGRVGLDGRARAGAGEARGRAQRRPARRRASPARGRRPSPALTSTSPLSAASSSLTTSVAAGPVTTSSRCVEPTRKKWQSPE